MNTNIPNDLMDNVERRLRSHVKNKKKHIYKAAAAVIGCGIILPTSVFAYANYTDGISYKQEIDLARQHNNISKINKSFKYKNVSVNIKEIIADDTGMEVVYDISDPRYSINSVKFADKDGKAFTTWSCTTPSEYYKDKEKVFGITSMDKAAMEYMKNNPVTITIDKLSFDDTKSKNLVDEASSFINRTNSNLKVDWTLKMQVPMQKTKTVAINKEYTLDIGTLKINSLKVGVLKSVFDYSFVPKDKTLTMVSPMFSIRVGNEYIDGCLGDNYGTNGGSSTLNNGNANVVQNGVGDNMQYSGTREFKSIYYKNPSEIGIKLVGAQVVYEPNNSQTYKLDKNKLPMEINYNGEKIKITSIEEKKDSTDYSLEYNKNNRIYDSVSFNFSTHPLDNNTTGVGFSEQCKRGKVEFAGQASRDKIYALLVKKVPNLKDIEKHVSMDGETNALQDTNISSKITVEHKGASSPAELKISEASKNLIYDEDEVIIKAR